MEHDAFLVKQLGIVGKAEASFAAGGQRLVVLAQLTVALRQQDIEFAHDRSVGLRPFQASAQQRECLGDLSQVKSSPAEIEQRKRIVGLVGVFELKQPPVALQFQLPER